MRRLISLVASTLLILSVTTAAASKPKVITFGKSYTVKLFLGPTEENTTNMKVRSLLVDGHVKEFTTGETHDITDRVFVVRRAFRLNNNLPLEDKKVPNWIWQKGSWLYVDRLTGRVSQMKLPEFDNFYSEAAWFRDYVAYCGVSEDGERLYAVVAQWGVKKPLLRKELGKVPEKGGEMPDAFCSVPTWEKQPTKVTFHPKQSEAFSFTVFGHAVDAQPGSTEED
ncbi:MAG TPA: hypothetical protein VMT82_00110 [candidate division Zixibacteria bacterium]|nr:hypothetical protein [candidate division Zixibacteria bacterium]